MDQNELAPNDWERHLAPDNENHTRIRLILDVAYSLNGKDAGKVPA